MNDPRALSGCAWCLPLIEQSAMSALRSAFSSGGVRFPSVAITTDSMDLLKDRVLRQSMLSVVPTFLAAGRDFAGVGRFWISGFNFRRNIGIVRRRDFDLSPLHAHFIASMRARFTVVAGERRLGAPH
jgi:DNA-binding transcriptional LysR family regulator